MVALGEDLLRAGDFAGDGSFCCRKLARRSGAHPKVSNHADKFTVGADAQHGLEPGYLVVHVRCEEQPFVGLSIGSKRRCRQNGRKGRKLSRPRTTESRRCESHITPYPFFTRAMTDHKATRGGSGLG